ncbi:Response regulator receiver domain-containing protein [Neorhodopirellula lusitana]|uniref:Response regulator receiver domain-containing protein n=1 Tax=Neorhodopirellula lusitana TaxID=445327 RepID=A0ABY1PQY7_9BACT|nr:response regulator [Neorhodopirellula lusitana]SMP42837.1 Response regulator receiver domain-containing protein [Neorhodopirellula lusitana]
MTHKRVLIVDDDVDSCANIKDILDDLGYRTDVAHDGTAALDLVGANPYAVAVLDYSMPGMNGASLHNEIVKLRPEISSIMVTASTHDDGVQRARDCGVQRVLTKPVDLGELLSLVKSLTRPTMAMKANKSAVN